MNIVFDGSNILHEAKFVARRPDWKYICYICIRSLIAKAENWSDDNNTKIFFLLDSHLPTFRTEIAGDYKADRKVGLTEEQIALNEAYYEASDFLAENLPSVGIITIKSPAGEADDFAYWITRNYDEGVMISSDRDWMINLKDGWRLYRHQAKEVVERDDFIDQFESPERYYFYRSMTGGRTPGVFSNAKALKYSKLLAENSDKLPEDLETQKALIRSYYPMYDPIWIHECPDIHEACLDAEHKVNTSPTHLNWIGLSSQLMPHSLDKSDWWDRLRRMLLW